MLSRLAVRSGKLTVDDFVRFSQMSTTVELTVHAAKNLQILPRAMKAAFK